MAMAMVMVAVMVEETTSVTAHAMNLNPFAANTTPANNQRQQNSVHLHCVLQFLGNYDNPLVDKTRWTSNELLRLSLPSLLLMHNEKVCFWLLLLLLLLFLALRVSQKKRKKNGERDKISLHISSRIVPSRLALSVHLLACLLARFQFYPSSAVQINIKSY